MVSMTTPTPETKRKNRMKRIVYMQFYTYTFCTQTTFLLDFQWPKITNNIGLEVSILARVCLYISCVCYFKKLLYSAITSPVIKKGTVTLFMQIVVRLLKLASTYGGGGGGGLGRCWCGWCLIGCIDCDFLWGGGGGCGCCCVGFLLTEERLDPETDCTKERTRSLSSLKW